MVRLLALAVTVAGCLSSPTRPSDASASPSDAAGTPDTPQNTGMVLFGDTVVEQGDDQHNPGLAQAASFTAGDAATVNSLWVYYGSATFNDARQLQIALYDDSGGAPNHLLTQGVIGQAATPLAIDRWYRATVPAQAVAAGTRYWIAVMAPRDPSTNSFSIRYRYTTAMTGTGTCDATVNPCTVHSPRSNLTAFPDPWEPGGATYYPSTNSFYATN